MTDVIQPVVTQPVLPQPPVWEDPTASLVNELKPLLGIENVYYDKLACSKDEMDKVAADVFLLVNLMRMIRKAMEEQKGDHINISALQQKIDQFNTIADELYVNNPLLFDQADNPLRNIDLNRVDRRQIESGLAHLQNIQTKRQSEMQNHMNTMEMNTMEYKMIMEVLQQMFKLVRDAYGYMVRKQVS